MVRFLCLWLCGSKQVPSTLALVAPGWRGSRGRCGDEGEKIAHANGAVEAEDAL